MFLPYLLSLRVSPQRARYLILTAKKLSAQDAFVYGIFDEVWEENQIEKKMKSLIKDMHRCSPKAFGEVKSFTRDIIYKSPEEIKSLAIAKLLALSKAAENKEAVNAFNQGEMPKWFSRFKTDQSLS